MVAAPDPPPVIQGCAHGAKTEAGKVVIEGDGVRVSDVGGGYGCGGGVMLVKHDVESAKPPPEIGDCLDRQVLKDSGGTRFVAIGGNGPPACGDGGVVGKGAVPGDLGFPLPVLGGRDGDAVND